VAHSLLFLAGACGTLAYGPPARIRVISPDRKSFRFITSPAMKHAATIAVVEDRGAAQNR
jgi:hypothetical protein